MQIWLRTSLIPSLTSQLLPDWPVPAIHQQEAAVIAGPFETQRQAIDTARVVIDSPLGSWDAASQRLLEDACAAAGVQLAGYDRQIVAWMSTWEPWVVVVICGLISRAHQAGKASSEGG